MSLLARAFPKAGTPEHYAVPWFWLNQQDVLLTIAAAVPFLNLWMQVERQMPPAQLIVLALIVYSIVLAVWGLLWYTGEGILKITRSKRQTTLRHRYMRARLWTIPTSVIVYLIGVIINIIVKK